MTTIDEYVKAKVAELREQPFSDEQFSMLRRLWGPLSARPDLRALPSLGLTRPATAAPTEGPSPARAAA